ncbi:MAG: hypothetical protein U9N61_10140 [Euryarchaeota archaeon]|nr:hypothetical protein [Euryarchaeota archaeon]
MWIIGIAIVLAALKLTFLEGDFGCLELPFSVLVEVKFESV